MILWDLIVESGDEGQSCLDSLEAESLESAIISFSKFNVDMLSWTNLQPEAC